MLYLKLPCAALERRLGDLASRGVTLAPGQTLQDLYDYRAPYYEKYADLVIDADQPRLEDTVALALAALRQL